MRIAVTTPRGHVGRHVASMMIRAGVRPLLLARNPQKIPHHLRRHSEVVQADSTDPQQVVAATRAVDAIYWVDPSTVSSDPLADYAMATRAVVEAVAANGISRVIFQSSVGAEKRHGVGEIDGLAHTEVALDDLSADVTHLRCGYFFTNLLMDIDAVRQGQLQTVLPLDQAISWVAPRDVAEVAAHMLLSPEWHGHRVQAVHGPQDLSWQQVAEVLAAHVGHPVRVQRMSDSAMCKQYRTAGMSPKMADALLGMCTGLRDDFRPEQLRTFVTTTPTTLGSWIHEELLPLL